MRSLVAVEDFASVSGRSQYLRLIQGRMNLLFARLLTVLTYSIASGAICNLQGAECHRRFMTILLPLHRIGELLYYTRQHVVHFLGPSSTLGFALTVIFDNNLFENLRISAGK